MRLVIVLIPGGKQRCASQLIVFFYRALPVCVLPSLTATDLQEVMKDVTYGPNEDQLTEDQVCIRRKRLERGS